MRMIEATYTYQDAVSFLLTTSDRHRFASATCSCNPFTASAAALVARAITFDAISNWPRRSFKRQGRQNALNVMPRLPEDTLDTAHLPSSHHMYAHPYINAIDIHTHTK